jgi:arginase
VLLKKSLILPKIKFMFQTIQFVFNESELGAGTRGASMGPQALQVAAWQKNSGIFQKYAIRKTKQNNKILNNPINKPFAKRIPAILDLYYEVSAEIKSILSQNDFPFVAAGDHSSAGGTVAGIKMKYPEERIGVVWIDAHADIHTPYTTPSGNMHGMPVATMLGIDNLAAKINAPTENVRLLWDELKNVGGIMPKILPEDLVYMCVRDTETPEDEYIRALSIKNFTVEEINKSGVEQIVQETLKQLAHCTKIYISFDVDSMDPEVVSHGTGTPVENGIVPSQAFGLMKGIIASKKVCCIEFVEINPCLDEKKNKMAETALELIEKICAEIENSLLN